MRIYVGLDGSPGSHAAFVWATRVASVHATVVPVACWDYPLYTMLPHPVGTVVPAEESMREAAEISVAESLAALADQIPGAVSIADPVVAQGPAADVLVELAEPTDLIVVGTRGHGAFTGVILGSVSSALATHTDGPVAVVPEDWATDHWPIEKILVGYDGTTSSLDAARWALEHLEGPVELLHAWNTPALTGYEGFVMDLGAIETSARELLDGAAESVLATTDTDPSRLSTALVQGDARWVLAEQAPNADVLVVGRRWRSRIGRAILGSVATSTLHKHLSVPIVVVPERHD